LEAYGNETLVERDLAALLRRRCDVCGAPLRIPDGLVVPGDEEPGEDDG
jgi:hypothetical protein